MSLLLDPRVRSVPWRDLVALRPRDRVRELLLPLPWLLLSLLAARYGLLPLALFGSFYFYLTGLRLVHDAFHRNLGLPPWANDGVQVAFSVLMLGSMHAVRVTHLEHHRDCLGPEDTEGATARRGAAEALLSGLLFPLRLHAAALRLAAHRQLRWIVAELVLNRFKSALAFGMFYHPELARRQVY
jgi:fatty acid desaturase